MKLQNYELGNIAVNAVIFTIRNRQLYVYLSIREKEPYKNLKELPGGLLLPKETAEETLTRKLKNILGNQNIFFKQFHTFTNPKRDSRGRIISIGFIALVPYDRIINSNNFYEIDKLPELSFDHKEIINKSLQFLKINLSTQFARQFLPLQFPLNDLQMVFEIIQQVKLDNRNFRRKVLDSGLVKKVKSTQKNVSHRPASLYQFVK